MATETPTINKIFKLTEFDLLRTKQVIGNMYLCLDSYKMYYDESTSPGGRKPYNYIGVQTVNDLKYKITPSYGQVYYCWEDNSLWTWINKWISLYTDSTYPAGYSYDEVEIYGTTFKGVLNPVYDTTSITIDDNGLLKDGSVVIRDRNRIIKGKLYVHEGNDNLIISSFLGGGIRLLPNGMIDDRGELFINDDITSFSSLRSQFHILNNELYVDYSEKPEQDDNPFPSSSHLYKVFHEGNLDASKVREITPEEIYTKLRQYNLEDLDPLDISVSKLNKLPASSYSLVGHTHVVADITDFNNKTLQVVSSKLGTVFNSATTYGIDVNYDTANSELTMSLERPVISFIDNTSSRTMGTMTLTVSSTVSNIARLTVDPNGHIHQNLVDGLEAVNRRVDDIVVIDPNNYYDKTQTDALLDDIKGTAVPTSGKPLLVNSNGILPGEAESANNLNREITIQLTRDITGEVQTDFSTDRISIETNASNIISAVPTTGKALLVDANGILPGTSATAKQLDHTIEFTLSEEATGTAILDTNDNTFNIDVTLQPGDNILQEKDLDVRVPEIDEQTGQIRPRFVPDVVTALKPRGTFTPNEGYPVTDIEQGHFWVADSNGTVVDGQDEIEYKINDWAVYIDGHFQKIQMICDVNSVNGYKGNVVLTYSDVNAISDEYINYTLGNTIPQGYIVRTADDGVIIGASVSNLTSPFTVSSDSGSDIEIASTSTNVTTDGTDDLGLKLQITQDGYNNIVDNTGYIIQKNGTNINHKKYLNFGSGILVNNSETSTNVSLDLSNDNLSFVYHEYLDLSKLNDYFAFRDTKPIVYIVRDTDYVYTFIIDDTIVVDTTNPVLVYSQEYVSETLNNNNTTSITRIKPTITLTFDADEQITQVEYSKSQTNVGTYISTEVTQGTPATFLPTQNYQPATKSYVDTKISSALHKYSNTINKQDITPGTYLDITHNLDSQNLIIQFRLSESKVQCLVDNKIKNNDTLSLMFNSVPNEDIEVNIISLY